MKYDKYLEHLFAHSKLSKTTKTIYKDWVSKCCRYHNVIHLLDLSPDNIESYRLYLLNERRFSPASSVVVYNAFKHTYQALLPQVEPEQAQKYAHLFKDSPRQPHTLPNYVSYEKMQRFLDALPHTVAGNIIRAIYLTSRPFNVVRDCGELKWRCSKAYAQQICASTARRVGIHHGFGLTGVRGVSIIHRIQRRDNDIELVRIKNDSGLSDSQFNLYCRAALTGASK